MKALSGANRESRTGWHRLSPKMLAVHPVTEAIRFLPVLAGMLFIGRHGQGQVWALAGLAIAVTAGLLRWFTTTYRITATQVFIRRGLLRRQELSVPRDRIRTVDLTAQPIQRLLGLRRVVIGTGRPGEGLTLDALATAAASRLREALLHSSTVDTSGTTASAAEGPEIAVLSRSWIRYGPFTLSGIAAVGVLVGAFGNLINENLGRLTRNRLLRSLVSGLESVPIAASIVVLTAATAIVVAVLSMLAYVLAFWDFRLTRGAGTLHVARGLLTTRSTTIALSRLRGAEINEPLLLRMVGGARCVAITTGLPSKRGDGNSGGILLPPAPRAEAERVASAVLADAAPVLAPLTRHGSRARLRRHTRAFAFATSVTLAALAGSWLANWPAWTWEVSLLLFPVCALLAEDRYRNLGHALVGGWLVFRHGSLLRRRQMLSTDGVIGWTVRRSFFQRRAGLATLTATTAAGNQHYSSVDIPEREAVALAEAATPGLLQPFLTEAESRA